ncbi:hypothetical protein ABZS66_23510 [Dactylosporangium sp. NPDC005572]|uniref:hypothetical protein n=1 Tax=Dactylosporangium sp. NPDC005572 TaxID=3156889 RepID=UPI0033A321F6
MEGGTPACLPASGRLALVRALALALVCAVLLQSVQVRGCCTDVSASVAVASNPGAGVPACAVEHWQTDRVVMTAGRLDPAAQTIETLRVAHTPQGTRVIPNRLRYVLPAELDLLAECAGLRLAGRYGDLTGSALPQRPSTAVSVYTAPPAR